jgi:hypothetical protein
LSMQLLGVCINCVQCPASAVFWQSKCLTRSNIGNHLNFLEINLQWLELMIWRLPNVPPECRPFWEVGPNLSLRWSPN